MANVPIRVGVFFQKFVPVFGDCSSGMTVAWVPVDHGRTEILKNGKCCVLSIVHEGVFFCFLFFHLFEVPYRLLWTFFVSANRCQDYGASWYFAKVQPITVFLVALCV